MHSSHSLFFYSVYEQDTHARARTVRSVIVVIRPFLCFLWSALSPLVLAVLRRQVGTNALWSPYGATTHTSTEYYVSYECVPPRAQGGPSRPRFAPSSSCLSAPSSSCPPFPYLRSLLPPKVVTARARTARKALKSHARL